MRQPRSRTRQIRKARRNKRAILIAEAGGRCVRCGYDESQDSLDFHHLDPSTKILTLGNHNMTRRITALREEAKKCILLCANCHRLEHQNDHDNS